MSTKQPLIIASVLLLISFITAYLFICRQPGNEQLFSEHFEPHPDVITSVDRSGDNTESRLNKMMSEYEAKNHKKALRMFNRYLKQNPDEHQVRLYRGITHMELGNKEQAIDDFEKLIVAGNKFGKHATWYLGLTYLKKGNQEQASIYFQSLMEKNTQRTVDAKDILNQMGKAMAVGNNRLYEITDNGKYKFTYWKENDADPHPITERTFYLEAKELDIISEDISYREFNDLSTDKQQTLLTNGQRDIIAEMRNNIDQNDLQKYRKDAQKIIADMREKEETEGLAKAEAPDLEKNSFETSMEKIEVKKEKRAKKQDKNNKGKSRNIHWMVKILTDAEEGIELPDKTGFVNNQSINRNSNSSSTETSSADDELQEGNKQQDDKKTSSLPSKDDLPWIVNAMTNADDISRKPEFNNEKNNDKKEEKRMTKLIKLILEPISI